MHYPPHPQRGFTLIELMIGLTLMALLVGLTLPAFRASGARAQLKSQTTDIMAAIASARSEAIRRGKSVKACGSDSGTACVIGKWPYGFIIVESSAGTIIQKQLRNEAKLVISGADNFEFGADGRSKSGTANLTLCSTASAVKDEERAKTISVSTTGRLSVTNIPKTSDCS